MKTLFVLLFLVSLIANVVLWHRVDVLEQAAAAPAVFPLGETMGYLQRYLDKLWYAGQSGNWDLARYYHDELAETAADVAGAGVVKDGVPVSQTLAALLPPALAQLDQAVSARDPAQFREQYRAVVDACNSCHLAAKRPFIHIALPSGPPTYWNQQFAPP